MKALIIAMILIIPLCYADIIVEKYADQSTINPGDTIQFEVAIRNDFDSDITVRLSDSTVFSGTGIAVECFEATVPKMSTIRIPYDPMQAFASGTFTIEPAKVTYQEPGTGRQMERESDALSITVTGETKSSTQSITEIYRCGGVSRQSTKMVTGGGTSSTFSFNSGGGIQEDPQLPPDPNKPIIDIIRSDDRYEIMKEELNREGYVLQEMHVEPTDEKNGEFTFIFRDEGREISVRGTVSDGALERIYQRRHVDLRGTYGIIILILIILIVYFFATRRKPEEPKEIIEEEAPKKKRKVLPKKKDSPERIRALTRDLAKDYLGIEDEITDKELIRKLEEATHPESQAVKEILAICSKAGFAGDISKEEKNRLDELSERLR